MKLPRSLLLGAALVALLIVLVIALAFTPAVQTWGARQVLARQEGMRADVGRVAVGLNSVRVHDLRVLQPGMGFVLPSAEIDLPLLSAARKRVSIKRFVAKGWTLDLTVAPGQAIAAMRGRAPESVGGPVAEFSLISSAHAQTSPGAVPVAVFSGLFELLQLPIDLEIESAELEGDVLFPATPGQPAGKAHVVITGGQLGAGREGRFTVVTSAEVDDPTAPVRTLSARSVLNAHMDTPRTFSNVSLTAAARAEGPQLPSGAELDVAATASRATNGEEYTVILRTPAKTLADIKATYPRAATRLDGTWKFDIRQSDVAPFALGVRLPTFSLHGDGGFALEQASSEVQVAGRLEASLERLHVLHPALRIVGALRLAADFDVVQRGETTRITRLQAQVNGEKPIAGLQALQGFEFNAATGELSVANPDADLLSLKLEGVPVAWAQPFLPGYKLNGGELRGEFTAGARDGGFALHPTVPITITGLSVSQNGQPLVRALDLALRLAADYTPHGWQAEVGELVLRSGGATLFTFQAKTGQQAGQEKPLIATGRYEADLPALLAQPIAQSYAHFARGRATGEFTASVNEKQEFATKLIFSDLAAVTNETLPKVTIDARVDVQPDGRIDARVPLSVEQAGRTSDLLFAAQTKSTGESLAVDAHLTSEVLYVEDLQRLAAPFSAPPPESGEPAPKPAPPGDQPIWAGITGQLALNLKRVVYSPTFTATDIAGTVKIGPDALTLDNVRALLGDGGTLKVAGGLEFEAKSERPYALQADVALTNVDPGPIFQSLDPTKPAPVEGRFDLTTRLAGRADDPASLGEAALGDVKLTSRGGTLRALGVKVNAAAENTSKLAAVAGIIGSIAGSGTAVKYADRVRAAADVSKQLAAIQFDQLNIVLERDDQNNFAIKDLTLISPLVRMVGSGQITYQSGVSVWRQPLLVNLQLGARDQLAENLRTLKLLGETSDPLGYAPLVEQLRLDGSVQSIGVSQLQGLLNRALAN